MKRNIHLLTIAVLLFLFKSCSTNPVTGKKEFMLMSKEQEIQMGKSSHPEILSYFGVYEDPQLQEFIEQKGQEMAAISHRPELEYTFTIVDSPVINAFAVPGGYVYFTRGIMAHFNNTAEFAGVLGHEIGHITARHSAKQYSRSLAAQAGVIAGSIAFEGFSQYANMTLQGLSVLFLKFGRDAERESDKLGVEYSTEIGYDAREMADFFKTLSRVSESSGTPVPGFLSTHSGPAEREEKVHQMAEQAQKKSQSASYAVERDNYLALVDGMMYGTNPRHGFFEDGYFYHPEMKFYFPVPPDWNTQNMPTQVVLAPEDGTAFMQFTLAQEDNIDAALNNLVSNNQLEVVDQGIVKNNSDLQIKMVRFVLSQEQQQLAGEIYGIEFLSDNYLLVGLTSAKDFNQYGRVFNQVAGGFSKLTDPEKLNRQPDVISIKKVQSSGPLQSQLAAYGVDSEQFEEHAILNGMTLDEQLSSGDRIKIIASQ
jgi:predicted Zn-dependent protease